MGLESKEDIFQPIEVEIPENKRAIRKQENPKNSRPFPANEAVFFIFNQSCAKDIQTDGEAKAPKEEQF